MEEVLGDSPYTHAKVSAWNNSIIEGCLKKLKEKNKNHKYVVTCVISQRKGTGFYAGSSVYWDNESDATASFVYEIKSLLAVVNVFALSL